jgi:hypothetical protein
MVYTPPEPTPLAFGQKVCCILHEQGDVQLPCVDSRPHKVPEDAPPGAPVVQATQGGVDGGLAAEGEEDWLPPRVGEDLWHGGGGCAVAVVFVGGVVMIGASGDCVCSLESVCVLLR